MRGCLCIFAVGLLLAGCAAPRVAQVKPERVGEYLASPDEWSPVPPHKQLSEFQIPAQPIRPRPKIVGVAGPLQCVPYARELSGIPIRGDAWTWWHSAEGKYLRSDRPEPGAILVMSRTKRLRAGHLAVVTQVLNDREIVVRHANWLNRGRIHLDTPVKDVSANNDWSKVKVWYTPGDTYGRRNYAVQGFILPVSL